MEVDALELKEKAEDAAKSKLNAMVAVTIALLATFMGICKVKDDNIVQAMQQAQANKIDGWGYYQAKNTQMKQAIIASQQLEIAAESATGKAKELALKYLELNKSNAKHLDEEKVKLKKEAEDCDKLYDALNIHDDQFDLSDASLALAISLLAVTALTQKKFLFYVALVPTTFGVVMGVAGLFSLGLHPDALTKLLSLWVLR